jgi:hypothetical protein
MLNILSYSSICLLNVGSTTISSRLHYRKQLLCRVSEALGKAWKTLVQALPSVTLDKEGSVNYTSTTASLPSTFCHEDNRQGLTLCRVSLPAWKTLGEVFVECDTRQRELGELYIGNSFFAEYFLSGTRQRLC